VAKLWPDAQLAAGPPVEGGFYYDIDLQHRITPDDFPAIEAEMKRVVKANQPFERITVSRDEALALAKSGRLAALEERPDHPSTFKIDLLQDIPEDEEISIFKNGDFWDRSSESTAPPLKTGRYSMSISSDSKKPNSVIIAS